MRKQFAQSLTVGAVPQLLLNNEAVLVVEEATPLFIHALQLGIDNTLDTDNPRHSA
jgi:hypothetical protein